MKAAPWIVSAALAAAMAAPVSGEGWRGFRGLEQQGVGVAQQSPLAWSASHHILWKAAVRGAGHSSPVITGDRVFLTTAYESEQSARMLGLARGVRLTLCLLAFALWLLLPPARAWWQEMAGGLLVALFVLLALADEKLLSFSRSPARAWLGAAAAAMVGLLVSVYGLERSAATRRVIAAALAILGVAVVAGMPGGLAQGRPIALALGVVAGGALVAAVCVLLGLFTPGAPRRLPGWIVAVAALVFGSVALQAAAGRSAAIAAIVVALAGATARALLGVKPALSAAWRASVIAAAAAGFFSTTLLVPRAGWVHAVVGIDRNTGEVLWVREGLRAPRTPVHRTNSQATPTPVTDGERVFAYFGNPGMMAVSADGGLLWTNTRLPFESIHGVGASPVLAQNTLVISGFTAAGPYMTALDAATGRERWRTMRPSVHPEFGDSRTLAVVDIGGRPTVVVWGMDELTGHDLDSGEVVWRYRHGANGRMGSMVASIVAKDDAIYLPLENGMIALSAAKLAAHQDPVLWTSRGGSSGLATPVLYDGRIFAVSSVGVASCTDARTGAILWRSRLSGEYYSSPVAMAGRIYFTNESGLTTVVAAASKYEALAVNAIDEPVSATIAPVDGHLYVRGHGHLFRIAP